MNAILPCPPIVKHFEVYTFHAGSGFVYEPAYSGMDRDIADAVAAQVHGNVYTVDGFADREEIAKAVLQ